MINDPYIEIINRTKSLGIDEAVVEQTIDRFMKDGADKALSFLIHDKKTPENDAWELMKEIKKEFRASYFANALYSGVFMILFLSFSLILFWMTESDNVWIYISTILFICCLYVTIQNLNKAFRIKL